MMICFLPCRSGSSRIPNKNIKKFDVYKYGLLEIKLKQLINVKKISKIIISTNDKNIIDYLKKFNSIKIYLDIRPENLCSNTTTTDELIKYAFDKFVKEELLWTHVTSPFIDTDLYNKIIESYFIEKCNGFDSLMTVSAIKNFVWGDDGPLNYDRKKLKWPFTQNIKEVYEINSGVFISSYENYKSTKDRIGCKPYLYKLNKVESTDIDWPEDFIIAEIISKHLRNV